MRSSLLTIKSDARKVMAKSSSRRRFHDLKYFEARFVFHISWIHYKLEDIITRICRKKSILCNFTVFQTIFWQSLVQYHLLAHHLHHLHFLKCRQILENIYQHELLNFVDQCVFKMFMIFSFTKFKLVYSFESLSLKPMQGTGVVHFTLLAHTASLSR